MGEKISLSHMLCLRDMVQLLILCLIANAVTVFAQGSYPREIREEITVPKGPQPITVRGLTKLTTVLKNSTIDALGRSVPTYRKHIANATSSNKINKRQDCGICDISVQSFDFALVYEASNAEFFSSWYDSSGIVSLANGNSPACSSESSYTVNNGFTNDLCWDSQYVGTQPYTGNWWYVTNCDTAALGGYWNFELYYYWGSYAASCIWASPVGGTYCSWWPNPGLVVDFDVLAWCTY